MYRMYVILFFSITRITILNDHHYTTIHSIMSYILFEILGCKAIRAQPCHITNILFVWYCACHYYTFLNDKFGHINANVALKLSSMSGNQPYPRPTIPHYFPFYCYLLLISLIHYYCLTFT